MSEQLGRILLPYQRKWIADAAPVKVYEKSRQIGMTYSESADDALMAAEAGRGGMDCSYIGYTKEMALEFIETAASWAKRFNKAAAAVQEFVFEDENKGIQAYRVRFASGHDIVALSSRPRNLRGKHGCVVIDEAAFHDDLGGLMKAAMALLMWGGRVRIISTHNGAENPFNELINDIRAGRVPYSLHRTTFDDALSDGLYRKICETTGKEWSLNAEREWRTEIFAMYRDNADEELRCIPSAGSGVFLSSLLIESRMNPAIAVVRWKLEPTFIQQGKVALRKAAEDFCETELSPALNQVDKHLMSVFGEDFGRTGDLTVMWPMQIGQGLVRRTPFIVELRNIPFEQQKQVLFYLVDRLPRFIGAAMDARGNGQYLAEEAGLKYGSCIEQVMLSETWYRENMPRYKAAFEEALIELPKDPDILADHRMLRMEKGVAKIPEKRTRGEDNQLRHGDSAIAGALAWYATTTNHEEYGYTPAPLGARRVDELSVDDEESGTRRGGWLSQRLRFRRSAW